MCQQLETSLAMTEEMAAVLATAATQQDILESQMKVKRLELTSL